MTEESSEEVFFAPFTVTARLAPLRRRSRTV